MRALPLLLLALVAAASPAVARGQPAGGRPAGEGRSGLAGVVTDFADRRLVGASIVAESDTATAISDRRGEFRVRGLAAGPRRFLVRRVGYQPVLFEVALPADAIVTVHVRLEQNAVSLGTMVIEGERHSLPLFREGFYDRAARHPHGWFFPPEEIVRRRITTVTSLLSEVPGVTIQRQNGASFAAGRAVAAGPCPFDIWLDGTRVSQGVNDLEELAPGPLIRAIEVYPSNATVPARFVRSNSRCGALVIWTKGVVQEMF